jgi:transposase
MRKVPDIGLVTADVVKAEIGDVSRFKSAENIEAYVVVSLTTSQSGDETWGGPTRHGNDRVKLILETVFAQGARRTFRGVDLQGPACFVSKS